MPQTRGLWKEGESRHCHALTLVLLFKFNSRLFFASGVTAANSLIYRKDPVSKEEPFDAFVPI